MANTPRRDTGDEYSETAQAAARLAPGKAHCNCGHLFRQLFDVSRVGEAASRPECMCSTRSQRAASASIVGDEHERRAMLFFAAKQKLNDVRAGCFVEIAGRFIGDKNRRIGCERPRDGDALLLAAGQLCGVMVEAVAQSHPRELGLGARQSIAGAAKVRAAPRHFPARSWSE